MNEPTTPAELAAILKREYDAAEDYYGQIEPLQELAFRFYEAQPFGHEVDGRSQIVLPDVQETVDYMTQSVLRTFVSGDRTIEFEASDETDEQAADDATAAIDYNFMRRQDGYGVLNDVAQDGNLRKLGIFKSICEETERVSRRWEEMPALALGMLPEDVEIENIREFEGAEGIPMARVLIKTQRVEKQYKIVAVPTQEFRFSPNARHEDDADYVAHVRPVTRSELVEMGFDQDQAYSLPGHSEDLASTTESNNLDHFNKEESTPALQTVLLCEEYARIDVDGDGIAERVKVFRVENEILIDAESGEEAIETVDEQPFAVFCPFPRPHRLVGYSLADKVMDIQLARSEIARQMFDGMAFANMPRPIVSESGVSDETLDDILNPIPGSPIRVRSPDAIGWASNTFDIGASMNAMEWMTGERESRTGITRMNQGLDADALNKTATGTALMQSQGQQFEEYVARNLAEAFARACAKLYRLMRVEAEPFKIRVDGKYREVDPSVWPEEVHIRIRVGLGTNAKDKRIAARQMLLEPLTFAMQEGMAGPEHAYNWMDGMARDTGIGTADDFMFDPNDPEAAKKLQEKAQQPDPKLVEAQGKIELEQQKAAATAELDRMKAGEKAQLDRDAAAADIETQREKHAMDMQVMRERAALESQLARDKAAEEIALAREKMQAEAKLRREFADANVSQNRPGGSLAE